MHKLEGQEMNVKKLCRRENNANHEEYHSVINLTIFSFWLCLWWWQMVSQSGPWQPVWGYQWSTGCVCPPPLLIQSICNQQSGLSTTGLGQSHFWVQGSCFPSGCCCLEGSGLSEQGGCCCLGDDSAPGSGQLLSQFSPQSFCLQSLHRRL